MILTLFRRLGIISDLEWSSLWLTSGNWTCCRTLCCFQSPGLQASAFRGRRSCHSLSFSNPPCTASESAQMPAPSAWPFFWPENPLIPDADWRIRSPSKRAGLLSRQCGRCCCLCRTGWSAGLVGSESLCGRGAHRAQRLERRLCCGLQLQVPKCRARGDGIPVCAGGSSGGRLGRTGAPLQMVVALLLRDSCVNGTKHCWGRQRRNDS
jgi:hypothetical protein